MGVRTLYLGIESSLFITRIAYSSQLQSCRAHVRETSSYVTPKPQMWRSRRGEVEVT
jgi:hypothetical protein